MSYESWSTAWSYQPRLKLDLSTWSHKTVDKQHNDTNIAQMNINQPGPMRQLINSIIIPGNASLHSHPWQRMYGLIWCNGRSGDLEGDRFPSWRWPCSAVCRRFSDSGPEIGMGFSGRVGDRVKYKQSRAYQTTANIRIEVSELRIENWDWDIDIPALRCLSGTSVAHTKCARLWLSLTHNPCFEKHKVISCGLSGCDVWRP